MMKIWSDWLPNALVGFVILTSLVTAEDTNLTDLEESNGPIITPNKSEIVLEKGQNFSLSCKGKASLEFKQQEIPLEYNGGFVKEPRIMNTSSDIDYPFETVLNMYNVDENAIGYYACFDNTIRSVDVLKDLTEEPDNTAHISYIYIYVNGTDSLFAPMRELVIPKGNLFMIECRPTTPDVEVTLNVDFPELYNERYSPKIGFHLEDRFDFKPSIVKCEFVRRGIKTNKDVILGQHVKPPPMPTITTDSKYFLDKESFVLNCTVMYDKKLVVNLVWNYPQTVPNDTVILASNEYSSISYGEVLYRSLTIVNATKDHNGTYTCVAKNSCGTKNATEQKKYLDQPFLIFDDNGELTKKNDTKQRTKQVAIIEKSYPAAKIYVQRNGKNLTIDNVKYLLARRNDTNDLIFTIKNITVQDSANYTLVADNGFLSKTLTLYLRKTGPPKITFGSDKKCLENTMVTFECTVVAYPLPKVFWTFSNGDMEQKLDSTEVIQKSIYELTARLKIKSQFGNISCTATNTEGSLKSDTRRLLIYEVPDGFGLKEGNDLWFWQKQDVAVKCFASIYDYKSVSWLNEDNETLENMVQYVNSSYSHIAELKINQITLDHAGNYKCRAITNNGIIKDTLVYITVEALRPPTITLPTSKDNRNKEVYPTQQNIQLHCEAEGVPPPQIKWEKDGVFLKNNSNMEIYTQKIGNTVINSTIIIKKMKEENKGKYECVAFNNSEQRRSYMLLIKGAYAYLNYLIVIIIIIFFLILLVAYLTWKVKKMKKFKRELAAAGLLYFEEGATKSLNPDLAIDEQAELLPYDKKFEFPQEKLTLGKQLGAGAFGVVYKAEARGIIDAEKNTTVAVKMVKKNAETMFIKALASELKIMVHLGKHVNIVNLLGACTKNVGKRELIVIVEYCKFGNIHNYMQRHREVFIDQLSDNKDKNLGKVNRAFSCSSGGSTGGHSDYFGSANTQDTDHTFVNTANTTRSVRKEIPPQQIMEPVKVSEGYVQPEWRSNYESDYSFDGRNPRPLTSRDLLAWAFQIARGMEYLASRKILHGDLAARNVLLADDNIVKICDFGLAKSIYKNDEYQKKENSPLPIKWLALESMTDRIFSTQSDVWSFGVVLWELFSLAKTPYPNISPTSLVQWLSEGHRLEKPSYADDRLYGVMRRCWEQKPTSRPSFTELQELLGTFLEDNVRNHYVDLNSAYMDMNVKTEGQQDYLDMVCAPDYNNLVTPSPHHYVNATSFFPITPTQLDDEGYLQMNRSPQRTIFSPRPAGTTFDFEARKFGSRTSEASSGSELTPMLALNRLPARSGSESDQECNDTNSVFANGCPRIDEESDDVFEKRNNEKNVQHAAVTNPTYITFDLDLDKKPKHINDYVNVNLAIPNGMVE